MTGLYPYHTGEPATSLEYSTLIEKITFSSTVLIFAALATQHWQINKKNAAIANVYQTTMVTLTLCLLFSLRSTFEMTLEENQCGETSSVVFVKQLQFVRGRCQRDVNPLKLDGETRQNKLWTDWFSSDDS